MEFGGEEIEFDTEIEFDAWEAEKPETGPDAQYPGCSAGVAVSNIRVTTQPDIETVRRLIRGLSSDDKTTCFDHNGVDYTLDYDNVVIVDGWDSDIVDDIIIELAS